MRIERLGDLGEAPGVLRAVAAGALGARMTGGGFGGCVIALAPVDRTEHIADAVLAAVEDAGYRPPTITRTRAGHGAALVR